LTFDEQSLHPNIFILIIGMLTTSTRTRPGPVERIQVLEVAVDRVVAVEKFIDREVPVMVEKVELVDRRVEVPVTHERVVQVPVEATAPVA